MTYLLRRLCDLCGHCGDLGSNLSIPTPASTMKEMLLDHPDEHSRARLTMVELDASLYVSHVFGSRIARLLCADPWGDRQDGFDAITFAIEKTDLDSSVNKRELLTAVFAAVIGGVEDRVAPVMYCALECLRSLLKQFQPAIDRSFVKYKPLVDQIARLCRVLLLKIGDSNKRTQREASQSLVRLVKAKRLKVLIHVFTSLEAKEKDISSRL